MPNAICRLPNGNYLEWSTVSDSPTTFGVPRAHFDLYARRTYGQEYFNTEHERRMMFADKHGTSMRAPSPTSFEDLIRHNRAGENETCLTLDEIVSKFGELPDKYYQYSETYFDEPDGFQVIDAETHALLAYEAHELLTWGLAQKVQAKHPSISTLILAKTFKEIATTLGRRPALRDGLHD